MAVPRRPISIAAAAATAVVLGATALALPASASTAASDTLGTGSTSGTPGTGSAPGTGGASQADKSAPAAPYKLKEGTLEWGFKESFRGYVLKSQGTVEVSDGAKQAAGNGVFTFVDGVGTYDMGKHAVTTAFKGTVRFQAPQRFTLQIADVKLVTEGKGGSIKADVTLDGVTMNDVDLASLDLTDTKPEMGQGGAMAFKGIPAKLTADGAKAFNGMYKAGDALDAATLTVKVDAGPPPKPDPEKPDPENPGKPDPENPGKPDPENPEKPEKPDPENPKPENPGKPDGTAGTILDGNLDWGVKESFREYVTTGFGKGKIEVSGGTTSNAAGFRFPKGKGVFDASKKSLSASFDGQVRFLGHLTDGQYVLDLKLSDLKVKVEGTKGTLLADVSTKDRETQKVSTFNDLGIASLAVPANALKAEKKVVTLNDVPATLTADGVKAFGGMYQAGIALDKVDVAVSLDKDVTLPGASNGGSSSGGSGGSASGGSGGSGGSSTGGSSVAGGGGTVGGGGSVGGSLAATGSDVPTAALLAASAGIAAAGAGVIYAARRRKATES